MMHNVFKLSAIALCATAFASLAPLSAGAASADMRSNGGAGVSVHAGARAAAQGTMTRRTGGTATHAAATFHGGRQFGSTDAQSLHGRAHMGNHGYAYQRYGDRGRFGYRHGYGVAGVGGYPYYSGGYVASGYGYRHHSCWWRRRFDPAGMPAWCGTYGYTYGYAPDYAYVDGGTDFTYRTYGRRYGYGHHDRAAGVSRGQFAGAARPTESRAVTAFHGGAAQPMEGRAALVGGAQNGARLQSGSHNGGPTGAAHVGGGAGAAHMGGSAHVGGHLNQH